MSVHGLLGLPGNQWTEGEISFVCVKSKKKRVKLTLEQAMKAQRGSKDTALLFL